MVNMSVKFYEETHNGLVSIMFTSLFPYMSIVTLTFDLWPPKSIGIILPPLTMVYMSAKFDEEAHNGVHKVQVLHMDSRTEPQHRYYIPSATWGVSLNPVVCLSQLYFPCMQYMHIAACLW